MRIKEEEINRIRQEADIVDVISNYIQVINNGRSFKAVCPFHDDHSPSLSISKEKQLFKCFSCGVGGNVFTFVKDIENIGFVDAVAKVASICGLSVDINLEQTSSLDPKKEAIYKVLNETIKYSMYQLNTLEGKKYRDYLNARGIDDKTIEKFEIGYIGLNKSLYNFLSQKGYSDKDMVEANLIHIGDDVYDVFYDRILFPIHDSNNNPVAFTARSINETASKYINTSETYVYTKGDILYNFSRAKAAIRKSDRVYLVEGVMDVIAFDRAKIYNVVASLGTACTIKQLNILKQVTNNIVFSYDGDMAGQSATLKAAKLAISLNFNVEILKNESGLDPDELIKKEGVEGFNDLLKYRYTWLEFCFEYYLKKYNLEIYTEKKEFVRVISEEINKSKDDFDRSNFSHKLSQLTGFKLNNLESHSQPKTFKPKVLNKRALPGYKTTEGLILYDMLSSKEAANIYFRELGYLIDDDYENLAYIIYDEYRKNDQIVIADFINKVEDDKLKNILVEVSSNPIFIRDFKPEVLLANINVIKRYTIEEKIKDLISRINREKDSSIKDELMVQYKESLKEKGRYTSE